MRPVLLALFAAALPVIGQTPDAAQQVYKNAQDSVFLIYLNDGKGIPTALGSAFLVAPHTLITNAHVANAGNPVLSVGPVRIPLTVVRTDEKNDLAVLKVEADLTSNALTLSTESVTPGEQVFAIGNPEGLEKTISQGIVSGVRKHDDRDLIQITTPISHGSSGGPILNGKGEVVGVAVGMLGEGQNLNFAVPVSFVRDIMAPPTTTIALGDPAEGLSQLKGLIDNWGTYSDDENSQYQKTSRKMKDLAERIENGAISESILTEVACLGTKYYVLSDPGIAAARKLAQASSSPEHRALLAYTLKERSDIESLRALIAEKDSDAQKVAVEANRRFLLLASTEAQEAAKNAKGRGLLLADYVLGQSKQDEGDDASSVQLQSSVATAGLKQCGNDLAEQAVRSLIVENTKLNRIDEAEKWFSRLEHMYEVYPGDWDAEGDRRSNASDYSAAAAAYEKAASKSEGLSYDYCFASNDRYLQPVTDSDAVLADGRKCVEASLKPSNKDNANFDSALPTVYTTMAKVLNERGVYPAALEYIQESLSRKPDSSFALIEKADILENMQRYSECVSVAQAAVRASDGKYSWMQFRLGSCYFDTQDWSHAEAAFRIAAEGDKTNAPAAFNVGLSLLRQGYGADARTWFREALSRRPDDELRSKILLQLN